MRLSVQIALLGASAALVMAQVPGRVFRFSPKSPTELVPGASLVELDDATFTRLRRRVLASSAQSLRWSEGATDREIGAFALEETLPPPSPLPLNEGFARTVFTGEGVAVSLRKPIKPASFAAPEMTTLPPSAADPVRSAADLLDLDSYSSLKD